MTEGRHIARYLLIAALLTSALGGLTYRLVYLHILTDESTKKSLDDKGVLSKALLTRRGRILDGSSSGNILALNVGVRNICADPSVIATNRQAAAIIRQLALRLNLDADTLTPRLTQPKRRFHLLSPNVPEEPAQQILALKLPGVFATEATARQYPHSSFLCHVLGFANLAGVGAAGIEQYMDRYLRGSPGLLESRVDGRQREIYPFRVRNIPPQDGADVVLTIDQNLQYMVEKALDEAMEKNRARGAWAIIERIRTGEILAMASRPGYNPNEFRDVADNEKLNRAIGYVFEPGSTFKPAVIAAALNENVVTPDTVFNCENGAWLYQGKILRDYHPYSRLSVADVVKKSSNIGAAKIALTLGDRRLDRYLREFGIGRRLGIDLPGEEAGILPPLPKWSKISASRIAMGQGVAVTSLQMLGVLCAIANDGFLMKPYVIKRVLSSQDGAVLYQSAPVVLARPVSGETAATMRQILTRVTEEGGTGTKAAIEGYKVAGKTGSAQKPVDGKYSQTDYWATFAGFVPAENPEIAIIVTLDEPQPFHTGGVVAAPVFGLIAEQATRYLDIPIPSYAVAGM